MNELYILNDLERPYPRICAHRGFNTIAPENSMPAFGAAIAMGADEIEFDLWWTKDGEIVSIHDPVLDRVSDGTGFVYEHTYEELLKYDFGSKTNPAFEGLRILRFEEILEKLACRTIMNIHLKSAKCLKEDYQIRSSCRIQVNEYRPAKQSDVYVNWIPEGHLEKISALIRKHHAEKYCYFKVGEHGILEELLRVAPEIGRCAGAGADPHEDYAETAMKYDCRKIQLFQPHFEQNPPDYAQKMIEKCHDNGIRVNIFWTDDPDQAVEYLKMGIETILTNDFHRVAKKAHEWISNHVKQ